MYLNSKQKLAVLYLSYAGALIQGHHDKVFKLDNRLIHALKLVDRAFVSLCHSLDDKTAKSIARDMDKISGGVDTYDECSNLISVLFMIDNYITTAFRKTPTIYNPVRVSRAFIIRNLKQNYSTDKITDCFVNIIQLNGIINRVINYIKKGGLV